LVTDYFNEGKKIFDSNDNIVFIGTFISRSNKEEEYKADCKLWVQNKDNSRIICKYANTIQLSDIYLNYTMVT